MRKRTKLIRVHLSDDKYADFLNRVNSSGYTKERYIRVLLSGNVPKARPPIEYWKMISELHVIETNLNQIAARANATGFFLADEYAAETKKLREAVSEIRCCLLPDKAIPVTEASE